MEKLLLVYSDGCNVCKIVERMVELRVRMEDSLHVVVDRKHTSRKRILEHSQKIPTVLFHGV